MNRKIVWVENVLLGEYKLLQMTLYADDVIEVHLVTDTDPQQIVKMDVPKRLFFQAALRLLEEEMK